MHKLPLQLQDRITSRLGQKLLQYLVHCIHPYIFFILLYNKQETKIAGMQEICIRKIPPFLFGFCVTFVFADNSKLVDLTPKLISTKMFTNNCSKR